MWKAGCGTIAASIFLRAPLTIYANAISPRLERRGMNVLDLFSGIGGFCLGLERAGMRTVAFCEIDPYCRRVLAKHWPDVPVYDDVRTLTAARLMADATAWRRSTRTSRRATERIANGEQRTGPSTERCGIDVICGGFPCQDISVAGKGAGIGGERSGLWSEYARIIGEVRPRYVIVENVAALLGRGLERVLGDLAALGYDAEWHCIPASAVGAPHRRDRVWIVAYARATTGMTTAQGDECDQQAMDLRISRRTIGGPRRRAATIARDSSTQYVRGTGNGTRTGRQVAWRAIGGSLNPTWVEWLMGFPLGWTVCEPSATPSSRKSPKSSDGQS